MSGTVRLTAAQALVRWLAAQRVDGGARLFGGVWAIFGHGNVAGIGEALHAHRAELPTYRAHNEQAMAHAAIAYAKAHMRRRMMACTTSIGPGATNMVTAAALAHVNRLPVLLLPGDVFVSRTPDPVLQQVEAFHDGGISANDCFRPVSRYFDRIVHPEQLLTALPRALHVLTDAALCGPVTLAMPQDVQTMACDWPEAFFEPPVVRFGGPAPIDEELAEAAAALWRSRRPLVIAGGGTLYGDVGVLRHEQRQRSRPEARSEGRRARRHLGRDTRQVRGGREVDDQRIGTWAALRDEDAGYSAGVDRVCAESVDRLGGQHHELPGAQARTGVVDDRGIHRPWIDANDEGGSPGHFAHCGTASPAGVRRLRTMSSTTRE